MIPSFGKGGLGRILLLELLSYGVTHLEIDLRFELHYIRSQLGSLSADLKSHVASLLG